MLTSENLEDKTYEEMISEAISRIPLYSDEWTNFNVSDPGITILQNLTSFNTLQQHYINEITDPVRLKLLKLLGFTPRENRPARVLLRREGDGALRLPSHKKLYAGELCFETEVPYEHRPWNIATVYSCLSGFPQDGGAPAAFTDVTYLLRSGSSAGAALFGPKPQSGASFCCVLDGCPDLDKPFLLWAQVVGSSRRRRPENLEYPVQFAQVKWQYYTADGWMDAQCEDGTDAFLFSGEIRLTLSGKEPAEYDGAPQRGYALRCVLEKAEYDLPPRLSTLEANLLPAVQCDTKAADFIFPGGNSVQLFSEMAAYGNLFVYCREEEEGPFRAYVPWSGESSEGRFYLCRVLEDGTFQLDFDRARFGFGPAEAENTIHIVCYEEETVLHRSLGPVLGYEGQMIDIDLLQNLLPERFSVMAEVAEADGTLAYSFVHPDCREEDGLRYTLLPGPGQIRIENPGSLEGSRLYLCECTVTAGAAGNIREQNRLVPRMGDAAQETFFINPAAGTGGVSSETAEQLRLRFISEMKHPMAAVLTSDYEALVRETPGLCIRKVKAVADEKQNLVKIAVEPWSEERFPQLSVQYREQIRRWLEPRRMIATRIELVQPRYIPISVHATLYVKSYYENARTEIETLLRKELDFTVPERNFGETVRYHDIFRKIEELPCVDSIYELVLIAQTRGDFIRMGPDIRLGDNSFCYPGTLSLELCSKAGTTL